MASLLGYKSIGYYSYTQVETRGKGPFKVFYPFFFLAFWFLSLDELIS